LADLSERPVSSVPVSFWRCETPSGHEVQIRRERDGSWRVTYGGFSRSTSASLPSALAEASASPANALWIRALVKQVTQDAPA
jgi:hypothetical protein